MAKLISPSRRCLNENAPLYFPFCDTISRNVLQDFKGSKSKEIKILFLGCQDLMNVLTTIASKTNYNGHMTLHLDHSCPLTFARNVLIVKVISALDFNVDKVEDMSYLWDLWYNTVWPKSTLDRFVMDVKELVERGLPNNCAVIKSVQLDELKDVWKGWLLSLDKHLIDSSKIDKVVKERSEFISNGGRFGKKLLNQLFSLKLIEEAPTIAKLSLVIVSRMEIEDFPELLKKKLEHEVDIYFETGNCRSSKIPSKAAINPTLLEPKSLRWLVNIYSCPFDAYLPLPWSELEMILSDPTESKLTLYCQKMLKNLVASYRSLVEFTNFHFSWSDKLEYFHIELTEKFDVIDCTTPAEELGLPNILSYCSPRLKSPDSLLITESGYWTKLASSIAQYVEKALCAPISMIPTLYGFRFTNPVDLGCLTLNKNEMFGSFSPIRLTWSPAPQFKNVPFCVSPAIEVFLKKLQKKCYFMEHSNGGQQLKEDVCFKSYTPLTCSLVASRLTQRERKQGNPLQHWTFGEVAPQFKLAQRAANDWAGHLPVMFFTTIQTFTPELKTLFNKTKILFRAPNLRLILIPSNHLLKINLQLFATKESEKKYPIGWADQNSDVHYIDNFYLHYHKNEAGRYRSLQLSFFLPRKHDMTSDHCAVLIELYTGSVMMIMGAVTEMEQQLMKKPCSESSPLSSFSSTASQDPYIEVVKCQESENDFVVEISINCKEVPKGLGIATDHEPPCEAAHQITFSLSEPEGIKPLTLCFPHPFMMDFIEGTLRRSDRCIRVTLKKALREPWPVSFSEKSKWEVGCLSDWKQSPTWQGSVSELMFHVSGQKTINAPKHFLDLGNCGSVVHLPELRQLLPLEVVRYVFGTIFNYFEKGYDIFLTYNVSNHKSFAEFALGPMTTKEPEFAFRAHRPILLSPCGSPMLLMSVLDCRMSKKLVEKGLLKAKEASEYLKRVFVEKKNKQGPLLMNTTEEGSKLLRYVLRLNSTKIKPNSWQEENLSLGKDSPFLATYISPLYREKCSYLGEEEDAPCKTSDEEVFNEASGTKECQPNPCAGCGKHSCDKLKRCSRCKITAYCTIECQRADWRKHKLVCAKSTH